MKSVKKSSESGQEASCSAAPAGDHDDVRLKGSVGERCSLERGRDGIAAQTILRVRVLAHDLQSVLDPGSFLEIRDPPRDPSPLYIRVNYL